MIKQAGVAVLAVLGACFFGCDRNQSPQTAQKGMAPAEQHPGHVRTPMVENQAAPNVGRDERKLVGHEMRDAVDGTIQLISQDEMLLVDDAGRQQMLTFGKNLKVFRRGRPSQRSSLEPLERVHVSLVTIGDQRVVREVDVVQAPGGAYGRTGPATPRP
jgi:hypothetical protein